MQDLENALINFYQQFTDRVYVGFAVEYDGSGRPTYPPFPYITFSYSTSEILNNTLWDFDIFTQGTNRNQVNAIASRIQDAILPYGSIKIDVPGDMKYEYRDPNTNQWVEVADLEALTRIVIQYASRPPHIIVEQRVTPGAIIGHVELSRGSPFIQDSPDDDMTIHRKRGNVECRNYLVK